MSGPRERTTVRTLLILSILMAFGPLSTDLYLPALPTLAHAMRTGPDQMALTLSSYLIGFSFGQLLWGPVGDRYGRRGPIAAGLALFVLGSLGCGASMTAWQLIGWRVVQAVGASAGPVLARAMVRDLYEKERSAQMLSTLMTVMAIAPLAAPLLGGQILWLASWRAIFFTLCALGVLALGALLALPETLPPYRRLREPIGAALAGYVTLARDPRVILYAATGGFFYAGIFSYIAASPFAYIEYFHVPAEMYGLVFALPILGIMAVNFANTRLVMRLGGDRLCRRKRRRRARWPRCRSGDPPRLRGSCRSRRGDGGLRRLVRLYHRQFDRGRAGRVPQARRRGLGARRLDSLRQRRLQRGAGRRARRWNSEAHDRHHRLRRRRKLHLRPLDRAAADRKGADWRSLSEPAYLGDARK